MENPEYTRPSIEELINKVKRAQNGESVPGVYILGQGVPGGSQGLTEDLTGKPQTDTETGTSTAGSLFTFAAIGALALFALKPGKPGKKK